MKSDSARTVLVTGGAGFIGSNLVQRLLADPSIRVRIFDNLSRAGVVRNLAWLRSKTRPGALEVIEGDVRDAQAVTHYPVGADAEYACDVAFLGNRLPDREARVNELFLKAAELAPDKEFLLGGEGWLDKLLPRNMRWIGHVPTALHNRINSSAGMVMNINRSSMADCGFSPPTRVFEAAGAGACLLCDQWPGIDDCFEPEKEIVVIRNAQDVANALHRYDEPARRRIGSAFRERALRCHTYAHRAVQADRAFRECLSGRESSPAQSSFAVHSLSGGLV